MGIHVRTYGTSGSVVVVLHGGPAAVGSVAPVARGLADSFRVLEPWQRGSGEEPLTVARHLADLHELVESCGDGARPGIVGWSWGAMLALAYAAEHPDCVGALALVGCGTFDLAARARRKAILDKRTTGDMRARLEHVEREIADPAERLKAKYDIIGPLHDVDALPAEKDPEADAVPFDKRAHGETWDDMMRLQAEGVYPAAFAAIKAPVLMLHGDCDPHPGAMIRASLAPYLPHLEYRELAHCGHSPWRERAARDEFFAALREWLAGTLADEAR
ncbi:MAG: alpha/beta hydrolase [Verrucomicrobia bacterium]|nr:alpha/beta hydrolase [Verrucomicrobiota bacterium]